jgi:hypothetical protein
MLALWLYCWPFHIIMVIFTRLPALKLVNVGQQHDLGAYLCHVWVYNSELSTADKSATGKPAHSNCVQHSMVPDITVPLICTSTCATSILVDSCHTAYFEVQLLSNPAATIWLEEVCMLKHPSPQLFRLQDPVTGAAECCRCFMRRYVPKCMLMTGTSLWPLYGDKSLHTHATYSATDTGSGMGRFGSSS